MKQIPPGSHGEKPSDAEMEEELTSQQKDRGVIDTNMIAKLTLREVVGEADHKALLHKQELVKEKSKKLHKALTVHQDTITELMQKLEAVEYSIDEREERGETKQRIRHIPPKIQKRRKTMRARGEMPTRTELDAAFPTSGSMEELLESRNALMNLILTELEEEQFTESEAVRFSLFYSTTEEQAKELLEDLHEIKDYLKLSATLKEMSQREEKERNMKLSREQRLDFFKNKIEELKGARNLNDRTKALIINFALEMPDLKIAPQYFDHKRLIREYLSHTPPHNIEALHTIASQLMKRKKLAEKNNERADKIGTFINTITIFLTPALAVPVLNIVAVSILGALSAVQSALGISAAQNDPAIGDKWQSRKAKTLGAASVLAVLSGIAGVMAVPEIFGEAASGAAAMVQAASVSVFAPLSVGLLIGSLALSTFNAYRDYVAAKETADKTPTEENTLKMNSKRAALAYNAGVLLVAVALLLSLVFPPSGVAILASSIIIGAASIVPYVFSKRFETKAKLLEEERIQREQELEHTEALVHKSPHKKTVNKETVHVLPRAVVDQNNKLREKLDEMRLEREKIYDGRPYLPRNRVLEFLWKRLLKRKFSTIPSATGTIPSKTPSEVTHQASASQSRRGSAVLSPAMLANLEMPRGSFDSSEPSTPRTSSERSSQESIDAELHTPKGGKMPEGVMFMNKLAKKQSPKQDKLHEAKDKERKSESDYEPLEGALIPQEPESPISLGTPSGSRPATPETPDRSPPPYQTPPETPRETSSGTPSHSGAPVHSVKTSPKSSAKTTAEPIAPAFTLLHELELNKLELQKRRAALKPKALKVEDKANKVIKPEEIHLDEVEHTEKHPKEKPAGPKSDGAKPTKKG